MALMNARCECCGKRFGWSGRITDRPPCPRCGHRPPQGELEAAAKKLAIDNHEDNTIFTHVGVNRGGGRMSEPTILCQFTVFGVPQPGGSKRVFPLKLKDGRVINRVVDDNPKVMDWRSAIVAAIEPHAHDGLCDGPLSLDVRFFLPRPKGHFGARGLRPSAPKWPTKKPDSTKLLRALEDALTGVLWRDDAQIVCQSVTKEFGEPARAEVIVCRLS